MISSNIATWNSIYGKGLKWNVVHFDMNQRNSSCTETSYNLRIIELVWTTHLRIPFSHPFRSVPCLHRNALVPNYPIPLHNKIIFQFLNFNLQAQLLRVKKGFWICKVSLTFTFTASTRGIVPLWIYDLWNLFRVVLLMLFWTHSRGESF